MTIFAIVLITILAAATLFLVVCCLWLEQKLLDTKQELTEATEELELGDIKWRR